MTPAELGQLGGGGGRLRQRQRRYTTALSDAVGAAEMDPDVGAMAASRCWGAQVRGRISGARVATRDLGLVGSASSAQANSKPAGPLPPGTTVTVRPTT